MALELVARDPTKFCCNHLAGSAQRRTAKGLKWFFIEHKLQCRCGEKLLLAAAARRVETAVIVITEVKGNFVQNKCMEHKGVRYAIRIGIAPAQWRVAIDIPGKRLPEGRTVLGTRRDAEATARSMINAWLKKRNKARGIAGTAAKLPGY